MTNFKHSPAPWRARVSEGKADVWEIIDVSCDVPIARVPRWLDENGYDSCNSEEATANLSAMTAAPDLIAACQMVVERWESGDLAEAARCCRSALDKAAGMSQPAETAEPDIAELLAARRQIAVIWGIEDVREQRPDLNDEQAWKVLQTVEIQHDAETGISFSTLMWAAFDLFGDAPDDEENEA